MGSPYHAVMGYLRMTRATWDLDLESEEGRALVDRIAKEGVAVFRRQEGFIRYRLMRAGPRRTVAVAEWESEDLGTVGAEHFREWLATAGIREHIEMETEAGPILVAGDV